MYSEIFDTLRWIPIGTMGYPPVHCIQMYTYMLCT